jgi:hypothetical protein
MSRPSITKMIYEVRDVREKQKLYQEVKELLLKRHYRETLDYAI